MKIFHILDVEQRARGFQLNYFFSLYKWWVISLALNELLEAHWFTAWIMNVTSIIGCVSWMQSIDFKRFGHSFKNKDVGHYCLCLIKAESLSPPSLSSVWINSPFESENDSQIHSTTTLPGAFARFLIAAEIYVVGSASGLHLTRWLASVPVIICFSSS